MNGAHCLILIFNPCKAERGYTTGLSISEAVQPAWPGLANLPCSELVSFFDTKGSENLPG